MKTLIYSLALVSFIGCNDKKKDKTLLVMAPPSSSPAMPKQLGNCDVDYTSLQIETLVSNKVILDDRGIDDQFKILHLNELNALPEFFLKVIGEERVPILLTNGGVTNFEELLSAKGKSFDPAYPHLTWDDVGGLVTAKGAFLATVPGGGNSAAIHESGHVIELLFDLLRKSEDLKNIYQFYIDNPVRDDARAGYRMSNLAEFFATGFDDFYCGRKSRNGLKNFYPKLHEFFEAKLLDEIQKLPIDKTVFESNREAG